MCIDRTGLCATTLLSVALLISGTCTASEEIQSRANILLILADDLGYGDISAYNSQSKIPTPHIDRLAEQGIRLTDAHAAATCIASRYQLMTGQYLFRNSRDTSNRALIEPGRLTLASLLKQAGYSTAMIGKWHLGLDGLGVTRRSDYPKTFDYALPLRGGPVDHGFDHYFGIYASLDVAPYFYIRNNRAVEAPTATIGEHHTPDVRFIQGQFWRSGPIAPGFKHEEVLPRFADEAVQYLDGRAGAEKPFFLYLALTAPHPPWLPTEPYRGRSAAGAYGDFLMQVDDIVGRVVAALEKAGKANDTLIIFTSDNGPSWYEADTQRYGHDASGGWRGMKADAWEGGHRIPFIARWPGKIAAGTSSAHLASFTDLLATFARLAGQEVSGAASEDSLDVLPVLLGQATQPIRESIVHEGMVGPQRTSLAIREGNWKLIPWLGEVSAFEGFEDSGEFTPSWETSQPGGPQGLLYNLAADPGELKNVYTQHPQVVQRLMERLERYGRDKKP